MNTKATYSVINMTGQEIKAGAINANKETFSTGEMASGVYFVKVTDSHGAHMKKFVVQ